MTRATILPIEGKAIRFAPSRNHGEPAASIWKIWVQGNEVYASTRTFMGTAYFSVHESGQVHYRLDTKLKQDLASMMQWGSGPWLHAFELRFLLSDGAHSPVGAREALKNKSAFLIHVPEGLVLYANLLIGSKASALDYPLPPGLTGETLWRSRLRDGRLAVLVGRLLPLDDQYREQVRFYREELKPTVTFSGPPKGGKYMELTHFFWSPTGGNVILAVPMGEEAFRSEQELVPPGTLPHEPRRIRYQSSRSTVDLSAPDGQQVATVDLDKVNKEVELMKGQPNAIELGSVTMQIDPTKLIAGRTFIANPRRLTSTLNIGGGGPHIREYTVHAAFDGSRFSVKLVQTSGSLRNKNLSIPISELDDSEEIVIVIPSETLNFSTTLDVPSISVTLLGRLTLRDHR